MSASRYINDRKLPERSFLKFYFPVPEGANAGYYTVTLPFTENLDIREKGKANIKSHDLIGRSGNLHTYLGAQSRKFQLSFNLTLDHIRDSHPEFNYDKFVNLNPVTRDSERFRFKNPTTGSTGALTTARKFSENYLASILPASQQEQLEELTQAIPVLGVGPALTEGAVQGAISKKADRESDKMKMIDLITYWVNVVRSSISNNATNPSYGPPIIRVNHGIMYQDVPCVCHGYSVQANEDAGHDLYTLLPRQIQITLDLEENRTGNFGEFDPTGSPTERDNLAGWEAVITKQTHSADPGPAPGLLYFK